MSGTFTEHPTPSPAYPLGITVGPDGNVWFTELFPGMVAQITTFDVAEPLPSPAPAPVAAPPSFTG